MLLIIDLTQSNTAVLQQVAQMVKHGFLILAADAAEVAQETTTAGNHLWESNFLSTKSFHHKYTHSIIMW